MGAGWRSQVDQRSHREAASGAIQGRLPSGGTREMSYQPTYRSYHGIKRKQRVGQINQLPVVGKEQRPSYFLAPIAPRRS
jgi:hypothetical protein